MTEPTTPSLMDDDAFLEELGRLDAKPQSARPRHVADRQVAQLETDMRAIAARAPERADIPSALLAEIEDDESPRSSADGEPRGLAPVLLMGLAAGAATAAFVLHERLAWIVSRAW